MRALVTQQRDDAVISPGAGQTDTRAAAPGEGGYGAVRRTHHPKHTAGFAGGEFRRCDRLVSDCTENGQAPPSVGR